jgi:SAM-dependent methyltransferase
MTQVSGTLRKIDHAAGPFSLMCWQCGCPLVQMSAQIPILTQVCSGCMEATEYRNGIWHALAPRDADHFRKFVAEYETIRAAEGRGSTSPDYYLGLPFKDGTGRNSQQWMIRARTFRTIERSIVAPMARLRQRPLHVLDLGAGNGWMSYRLSLQGHHPIAVDLLTNDRDGLGAAAHYAAHIDPMFPCVQAALDHLPFASSAFDLVIFNASFHYSESFETTFAEALRCTRPGGSIVIADTPWYAEEESGRKMVKEKHHRFAATYGFRSDSIFSLEYLTPQRLLRLRNTFPLEWRTIKPFYGLRWAFRPLLAKIARRRPPSQFRIYEARLNA